MSELLDKLRNLVKYGPNAAEKRFISGLILMIIFIAAAALKTVSDFFDGIYLISPFALFHLEAVYWHALSITAMSSFVIFFAVWLVAYGVAFGAAVLFLIGGKARYFAEIIKLTMDFIYIVPLVLLVSIASSHATLLHIQGTWPTWMAALLPMFVAVFVLSGYQIFESVYNPMTSPDSRTAYLVDSLRVQPARILPPHVSASWQRLSRRVDFAIRGYNDAVVRAFHLAVVGVVITEMIVPSIYTNWAMLNIDPLEQLGLAYGVGGLVARLQNSAQLEQVAGLIWGLYVFDLVIVFSLRRVAHHRHTQHYGAAT